MIADQYLQLRSELETALAGLLRLGSDVHRDSATLDIIHGLLTDIREPLLFVVVGEVKAGKSSLLNALFGQEFAKVDVLPATDRVCIFRYGEETKTVEVSPQLTERYEPINFLRDFNVVDTPGTNTMVAEHQTITESFVPRADVVLFVFSVINPWTQSAWGFLQFVQKKWLKNVVFVLQQSDLREPSEINVIRHHLLDTAKQKLGFVPPIFAVSARRALLARTQGLGQPESEIDAEFRGLEDQINVIVTEAGARMLKLKSAGKTGRVILGDAASEIRGSFETIVQDEDRLARVAGFLQARKDQTLRQVAGFLRGVESACRDCVVESARLLEKELSFWRTWRLVLHRGRWREDFQRQVEDKLRQTVQPQIENAVQLLENDLRTLWPQLQDTIEMQFASQLRTHFSKATPDFARQRRELLQSLQLMLHERVAGKGVEEQLAKMFQQTSTWLKLPVGVAAAGGIVALVAAMSSAAVADVTGVLAASAAVIGAVVALSQRKRILNAYEKEMERKRSELMRAIEQQMEHAIDLFYRDIVLAFEPLAAFCLAERRRFEPLLKRVDELERAFADLASRLGQAA
jgi:GTPase SAR1 family protein